MSFISVLAVSLQKQQQGAVRPFLHLTVGEWIQFGSAVTGLGGKFSAQWSCACVRRQGTGLWMLIWCSSPFRSSTRGWKSYVNCFPQSISAFILCLSGLFKYRGKKNHQDLNNYLNKRIEFIERSAEVLHQLQKKKFERFLYILKPIYSAIPYC